MMAHLEDTFVTDFAVVSSGWFDFVTGLAFFRPESFKILHCFGSVFHKSFYIFL